MRPKGVRHLGIALLVIGLSACTLGSYWFWTRNFFPLRERLTLTGHQGFTREFRVNAAEIYFVEIGRLEMQRRRPYPQCPLYDDPDVRSHIVLTKDGKTINPASNDWGIVPDAFELRSGTYKLDLEVTYDTACFDKVHGQLDVGITDEDYSDLRDSYARFVWFMLMAGMAGATLVFFSTTSPIGENCPSIFAAGSLGNGRLPRWSALQRLRLRRWAGFGHGVWEPGSQLHSPTLVRDPARSLPTIGFACSTILFIVWVPMILITASRVSSVGLPVRVLGPRTVTSPEVGEPIVVRLDAQGRWYLNSKPITPRELPSALRKQLARTPAWVVYFDGDSNLEFAEALHAIDIIRNEHAQVILLTEGSAMGSPRKPLH